MIAPYGVQGWVKVKPFTAEPSGLLGYRHWLVGGRDGQWRQVTLEQARQHGATVVAKLQGVDDRSAAEPLKGWDVAVERASLPPAGPDEFYWADLVGLSVVGSGGAYLGRVERLMATGANDVLVVVGERERLIPFVAATVLGVDLGAGTIAVDWEADW